MHDIVIALVSGLSVAVVTQVGSYIRERKARKETKTDTRSEHDKRVDDALIAVMHNILFRDCKECIQQGEIEVDQLANIEMLYTAYHEMGGNGTGTQLYKRVCALPIKDN